MDKVYKHLEYEQKIYSLWEKSGVFSPSNINHQPPFTIIMPPPNASDPLHIGHARFVAIEDILIRYHRMKGEPTLWLPGADHAGVETQYVFEKKLKAKGDSRFNYDRETLYKMIWDYVQDNKKTMEDQLKKLGASCDWSRNKFTLDPKIIKIVYKIFKKLYNDGLIYRGERIVNYCPRCGTAFSQLEVNYVERDDPFYFIDYGLVTIATTRPETIFADVAIAINPKDLKNKNLIGKKALIPLINREIPIISDPLVDLGFGTGALKITPGHDPLDFEIGQKHKLSNISVIDAQGKMTNTPQKYIGMKADVARNEVVKDLQNKGIIKKIETIHHTVGTCYRDKGNLEPMISKQWYLKVEPLVKSSLKAMKEKRVIFTSNRFEKIAKNWYKNLKDWNISRQIVWGIRIPAFRCEKCLEWTITDGSIPKKCFNCDSTKLNQDPDTFDTWFSSGQWPFATLLSSPNSKLITNNLKLNIKTKNTNDFSNFYPTSVMETAYDILPFWVIRMIMLGIYATGEVPFRQVLIHGLVRDKEGEKISKSKGNVINPIDMAEKYGADALRMALIWGSLIENDICLSEDNIKGQRNFSNKIWNIARFIMLNKPKSQSLKSSPLAKIMIDARQDLNLKVQNKDDKWILEELKITTKKVTKSIDKYRLNEAAKELYDFIWHKFADKYIEIVKEPNNEKVKIRESAIPVLYYVLACSLRLLHPFMPFLTETLWQELKSLRKYPDQVLINSPWPTTK